MNFCLVGAELPPCLPEDPVFHIHVLNQSPNHLVSPFSKQVMWRLCGTILVIKGCDPDATINAAAFQLPHHPVVLLENIVRVC